MANLLVGKTLKQITESTGAAVQVPARDANESPVDNDDNEGPLIPVTITGPSSVCAEAKAQIMAIVSERAAKLVTKIDSIPASYWPFISGFKGNQIAALVEGVDAKDVNVESRAGEKLIITITGEREAVGRVVAKIHSLYAELVSFDSLL